MEKDELLAKIWPGADVGENNLHVHISGLRKLLGDAGRAHLVTVPGFGYRLLSSAVPVVRQGRAAIGQYSASSRFAACRTTLALGVLPKASPTI